MAIERRSRTIGLDGSTVSLLFGNLPVPLVSASYADSLTTEWQPNMGSQERGEQSRGTYSCEDCTIVMSSLVYRSILLPALPVNGAGNLRFNFVVSFVHPDLGDDSDLLENCRIVSVSHSLENTAKITNGEIKLTVGQIRWGDRRVTLNALDNVEETGENGLGA